MKKNDSALKNTMETKAKPAKQKPGSSVLSRIVSVVAIVLCVIFGLMLLFNLTIIIKGLINPNTPPSVFGYTPLIVKSGSMSSNTQHTIYRADIVDMTEEQMSAIKPGDTVFSMVEDYKIENKILAVGTDEENPFYIVERPAKDHIETGDLIFSQKIEPAELKVGDVISYMEDKSVVTHRIVRVNSEGGKLSFTTKGDFNNGVDTGDPVAAENVVGIYKARVPALGDFIFFLQQPVGMAIFIGVPVLAFVIFDIIRRSRNNKKADTKAEELEKELERLRALAKQQEEKAGAEGSAKPEASTEPAEAMEGKE